MASTDLSTYRAQHAVIQKEYAQQAPGWTLSNNDDHHGRVIEQVTLEPHFEGLDVAAGTGLLSRQLALHVKSIVALDLTPEMLAYTVVQGTANVRCEQGAAEAMPYPPSVLI